MKTLSVFLLSLLFSLSLFGQTEKSINIRLDHIMQSYSDQTPGYALGIIKNQELFYSRTEGFASWEPKRQIKEEDVFNLSGISKQFTAMAILQLIDRNKIQYSTTLNEILPNIPGYAGDITVDKLLLHNTYLPQYDEGELKNHKDVLSFLEQYDELRKEGDAYSNVDFPLLALVIEEVSGKSYAKYLERKIFRKLKMEQSFVATTENRIKINNSPALFEFRDSSFLKKNYNPLEEPLGEQGIYSTIADYVKFEEALYTDKILDCETLDHVFSDKSKINYFGYGWVVMTRKGVRYFWTGSSNQGYSTLVLHIPGKKFTMIFMSNISNVGMPLRRAFDIARIFVDDI